jgi:hypothetical protein
LRGRVGGSASLRWGHWWYVSISEFKRKLEISQGQLVEAIYDTKAV